MSGTPMPVRRSWGDVLHAILHHDFCPGANRWLYWVKRPEASLALAALSALACAIFIQPVAFVAFAAIMATLLLGWCWPCLAMRGLHSELQFIQSRTTEGQPTQARLIIRNRWPWPVWGLTLDEGLVSSREDGTSTAIALARVPGWATIEFDWDFSPECRGSYPFAAPSLTTGFPFGLIRASRPVSAATQLLAWPQAVSLDVLLDSAENRPSEDLLCEHRVGDCGDLLGTRVFRQGDPLRRVHWAQTARHGRLIVCERQAAVQAAIRIVVDLDPAVHAGSGPNGTLEWSIRLAASVGQIYHQQHAAVECHLGHKLVRVSGGEIGWKRFLDELAQIPREGVASERPLPTCSHRRKHHEVLEVVVTTDRGLKRQPELQHPCGRQRCVILQTSAFLPASQSASVELCAAHHWVLIDSPHDIPAQFQRKWRRLCHEH